MIPRDYANAMPHTILVVGYIDVCMRVRAHIHISPKIQSIYGTIVEWAQYYVIFFSYRPYDIYTHEYNTGIALNKLNCSL